MCCIKYFNWDGTAEDNALVILSSDDESWLFEYKWVFFVISGF